MNIEITQEEYDKVAEEFKNHHGDYKYYMIVRTFMKIKKTGRRATEVMKAIDGLFEAKE